MLAFWAVVAGNGGIAIWMWLEGGGVTSVTSAASLLVSTGRIAGLTAGYLVLVQVLLMARLPALERRIGFDRLNLWHRRSGRALVCAVVTHIALIVSGYSATQHVSLWNEYTGNLLSHTPGIVDSSIAAGLLLAVSVSSFVIARRRLPYEAWYAVHLTVYAAIYLATIHQIADGNEFVGKAWHADWWRGLYITTGVLLVRYRFLGPALTAWRYRLRVTSVARETPDTVSVVFGGRRLDRLAIEPGQFMLWRFLTPGRWWQSHPFSLSAAPDGRSLRITVKAVGRFTRELADVRPGTRVLFEGPFGRFVPSRSTRDHVTMIAGGIGVTPLRAMLEDFGSRRVHLTLVHRVASDADRPLRDEIERLAGERDAVVHYVVGDHRDRRNADLLSVDHLLRLAPNLAESDVFVCGPPKMMETVTAQIADAGVASRQIHTERFGFGT